MPVQIIPASGSSPLGGELGGIGGALGQAGSVAAQHIDALGGPLGGIGAGTSFAGSFIRQMTTQQEQPR